MKKTKHKWTKNIVTYSDGGGVIIDISKMGWKRIDSVKLYSSVFGKKWRPWNQ